MKRLLYIALLVIPGFALAQFEGTVTVSITYELPPEQAQMASMLPKSQVFQVRDEMTRMEMNSMGANTIMIRDNSNGLSTMLISAQGQKFKMTLKDEEIESAASETKVELLDETKEILGYACNKALVTMEGEEGQIEVFYTKELPAPKVQGMEKIDGFPLEYHVETQGMKVHYITTDLKKESIDAALFEIPDGYQEMPASMRQMMGLGN